MLRLLATRALLLAAPFIVYFVWRAWARRSGREVVGAPWAWLVTVGCLLVGGSLLTSALFNRDTRGETYVPAEARADGSVTPGRFQPKGKP